MPGTGLARLISMKYEYRMVDTSTLEGLKRAERLKATGWRITRVGLFLIWFERAKA